MCYLQFVYGEELCSPGMMSRTHDASEYTNEGTEAQAPPPEQEVRAGTAGELSAMAAHAVAFLLSQLGAYASALFAERVAPLDLTPPQVGFLRLVGSEPGSSQQAIAGRLGMAPNRLVHLVDEMQGRGLIERRRHPQDRRNHALHLTAEGTRLMGQLSGVAAAHEEAICAGLAPQERQQLGALLERVAANQGLQPGIHPGYRLLGR
jgi:DNA-binding MarR family transcriptional regulator